MWVMEVLRILKKKRRRRLRAERKARKSTPGFEKVSPFAQLAVRVEQAELPSIGTGRGAVFHVCKHIDTPESYSALYKRIPF